MSYFFAVGAAPPFITEVAALATTGLLAALGVAGTPASSRVVLREIV